MAGQRETTRYASGPPWTDTERGELFLAVMRELLDFHSVIPLPRALDMAASGTDGADRHVAADLWRFR